MSQKVLYCLRKMAVEADLLDMGSTPSMARYSRYRRRYVRFPPEASEGRVADFGGFVRAYIETNQIDAVVGADIAASAALDSIRDVLQDVVLYPVSNATTLEMLDDKWQFQKFMEANDVPHARTTLLSSQRDIEALASDGFECPLIVKPLHGESSHGVVKLNDIDEIAGHIRSGAPYARLPLLAQQYVDGFDADLSVLAVDGRVKAHVLQSRKAPEALEFISNDTVLEIVRRIVAAAEYSGVMNVDVRIQERTGAVTVLECNPRFWYTLSASLWRGLNFVEEGLNVARGAGVAVESVVGGSYFRHRDLLTSVLWSPSRWSQIRAYNLLGFWQTISDPLPFLLGRGG
jgi:predicted ATP-grasp superfamily ATP-dependent carboligase